MKNKSGRSVLEDDEAAEAEAARARRQGIGLIESHLSHHLSQNPESSFVTWIATLHPENAEVTIDQRFFVPGNAWWTVYEEAKNDIPTATAVLATTTQGEDVEEQAIHIGNQLPDDTPNGARVGSPQKTCTGSSPLASLVGIILAIMSVITVFILEVSAVVVYITSAGFFILTKAMDPPSVLTGLPYSICCLLYWSLALVDSFCLVASVFTTELLAGCAYLLCAIFGGCGAAAGWHQFMRRICHLIRWAFRSKYEYPPRRFCRPMMQAQEMDSNQNDPHPKLASPPPTAPPSDRQTVVDVNGVVVAGDSHDGRKEGV
jgi:hypothetical protein